MKKFFNLFLALLALFSAGLPAKAQDEPTPFETGYYYIYTNDEKAMENLNHFLRWDFLERGNAVFMFRLEKAATGEDEYWMQSLADGAWFYGVTNYYITELRGEDEKQTIRFVLQDDGSYKVRATKSRSDLTGEHECHNYFSPDATRTSVQPYEYHPLSQWNGALFTIEKVPADELAAAKLKVAMKKALDTYTNAFQYSTSSEGLVTNAEAIDQSTGEGSQFFSTCQQLVANSSFANLIDGTTSTSFQGSWDPSVAEAPQWIQVDAGKEINAFQLKYGICDGFWGSAEQITDFTIYGSNDEVAANSIDYRTLDDVQSSDKWTKIGDYEFGTEKSLIFSNGNWGLQQLKADASTKDRFLVKDFIFPENQYRYLRFFVNKTSIPQSDNIDFLLGEFQLYENTGATVKSNVVTEVEALKSLIANTKTLLANNTGTEADVQALYDAIDAINNKASQAQLDFQALVDSISALNIALTPGTDPGYNDSAMVATYKAAFAAAQNATHEEHTDAEFVEMGNNLRAALAEIKKSVIPVTEGYYNFVSTYALFQTKQHEDKAICGLYDQTMGWSGYNPKEPTQLFKVTKLANGNYSIYNIGTSQYIGAAKEDGITVPSTAEQEVDQIFTNIFNSVEFNISNTTNASGYNANNDNGGNSTSGNLVSRPGGIGSCSAWRLVKVTDQELIDSLTNVAENGQLLYQASRELAVAKPVYEQIFRYNVDHEAGLITNADDNDPDSNQFWGTQEPGASSYSSYAQLIDGKTSTCFQSTWSESVAAPPQWLQVDLKDHPVESFQFYFGLRDGQWGALEQWSDITLYATNDETLAKDENVKSIEEVQAYDGWKKIGDYQLPTDLAKNDLNGSNRGFYYNINRMGESYRFLRFFVNSTYQPQANMMYTIGEFQVYENVFDEANSPYAYVEGLKEAGDNLDAQIKNVEAELAAGAVSAESLEKLVEAYKAVQATVPDTAPLEELLASVKKYVNKFEAGEEYGDVTEEQWTTIQDAITNADAYDHDWPRKADLEERLQSLTDAFAAFKTQQKQFEANKWFYLVNQDQTRQGSEKVDGVPGGSIYQTFCYGNVAYAPSDNTLAAAGGWGTNNNNALKWGYYNRETKEPVYESIVDPHTMWRFVPIEGEEGYFAIQNRANGLYMQNYSGNANTWISLTNEPKPYCVELLGSGQYKLISKDAKCPLLFAGDGYLYTYSNDDGTNTNTEYALAFEEVPTDLEWVQFQIADNSIQIMSLPYALDSEELVDFNVEAGVQTYAIKSFDVTAEGDSTLSLVKKSTFEAGEPFILVANNYEAYDPENVTTTYFAIAPPETYSFESKTANGLTATLDYTPAPKSGFGYFANSALKATKVNTGIAGHTGYFDVKAVVDADPAAKADLVIKLNGSNVTAINKVVANKSELVNVYSIDGKLLKRNVKAADALKNLSKGIYVVGETVVAVK